MLGYRLPLGHVVHFAGDRPRLTPNPGGASGRFDAAGVSARLKLGNCARDFQPRHCRIAFARGQEVVRSFSRHLRSCCPMVLDHVSSSANGLRLKYRD